ncbi:MAG: flagellar protein FliT [Candidatus Zixiibacteriota bacterium]|nr:MAG: flagellar protein FliT [candidate division Zixibacteria bacterium]
MPSPQPLRVDRAAPWTRWIQIIRESNRRLNELLAAEDWEAVNAEVGARGDLLAELRWVLDHRHSAPAPPDRLRQVLDEFMAANRDVVARAEQRRHDLEMDLQETDRGKRALELYRTPRPDHPRFLDRRG